MNFYGRPTRQNRDLDDLKASLERCRHHLAASQEREVCEMYQSLIARYEAKLAELAPAHESNGSEPESLGAPA